MAFFMFVLLLLAHGLSPSMPQCLRCDQTSCSCLGLNLRRVPAAPSQPITALDLSHNWLDELANDDFLPYANLRSLIMNHNRIKTIQHEAFAPLMYLEELDLSFNQLEVLSPWWFQSLFSLKYLNILENKYTTLQGDLFQSLKMLTKLHFGGSSLQSVKKRDFSGLLGLKELVFDGKNLQDYEDGSLKEAGFIGHVTLGLNGAFWRNLAQVRAILSDVVYPNTTLTFTDTNFLKKKQMSPFRVACNLGATSITLKHSNLSIAAGLELMNMLSGSNLVRLALEGVDLDPTIEQVYLGQLHLDKLEDIYIKDIDISWFYSFPAFNFLEILMKKVRRASLLNTLLFAIPCQLSQEFLYMEFLDISDNLITDLTFSETMCDGNAVLSNLKTINISRNYLQSINSRLFTRLQKLEDVDMSGNLFEAMPETCYWPASLRFLNLSSSHLTEATRCLPLSLQTLDLSKNRLSTFNIELPSLKDLYISGNRIRNLPEGRLYPQLTSLSIRNNELQTFSSKELHDHRKLERLDAGENPYICSCDFVAFVTSGSMNPQDTVADNFQSFVCESPDAERGRHVADVRLSVFECHTAAALTLLCLGLLVVCVLIAGLCYKFSVVWYMKMTWAWLKAKRKPKLKKKQLDYDAFVSYSDMDSGWVEAHLVPALEKSEPPLRLCLHKRDFVPGGWILDNIMNAIERSQTTLFILSQHFVRSEWCKYELDYSHFRLFNQNDDAVVLILLEHIDKKTIPKKFCRLRRAMNSRTYLEWPDDEDQIPTFWQNLRAAMNKPETVNKMVANEDMELELMEGN